MTEKNEISIVKREITESFTNPETQQLIRDICAPKCTETEFNLLRMMAIETGLNPLMKQIYCYKITDTSPAVIVAGIHGMRLAVMRTGELESMQVFTEGSIDKKKLRESDEVVGDLRGIAIIKRRGLGEIRVECAFDEFVKRKSDGTITRFWKDMPEHMIKKTTESVGWRQTFPDMFSGIFSQEEIEIDDIKEVPIKYPESKSTLCEECHDIPYDEDISERLKDYIDGKRVCRNCGKKLYDEWKKDHDNEKVIDAEYTEKEKEPEKKPDKQTFERSKDKKAEPEPEKSKEAPKKTYTCEDCGADITLAQQKKSMQEALKPLCNVCLNAFKNDGKEL